MLLAVSLFSSPSSVLLGWDPGVWFALCLHLCLLQESTSSQNLAAVGEEGSVGCILQSCCDWNPAACCCCNCLHCNGLLRPVYQMNSKPSNSSTANQGIKMKNLSETWTQCRRVELKSLVSPR
uniref:Transmembrane protein 167B n=1 Tax=Mus musculus TaxID=10090 RepID=A2AGC3_MOUSE